MTSVIFLNTGKPTREQIKEKFFSSEFYLITDEKAFESHLFRKWIRKMSEKRCSNCKYLNPIISLMGDYWCSKNDRFFCIDDLSNVCDSFTFDVVSLTEKEDKIW